MLKGLEGNAQEHSLGILYIQKVFMSPLPLKFQCMLEIKQSRKILSIFQRTKGLLKEKLC
jgi:hypothetical protein